MSSVLLEHQAKEFLRNQGIPVLDFKMCTTEQEAIDAAQNFGFPVVMKVVSPQIVHKSDAGCVKLNLQSEEGVATAYAEIMISAKKYDPNAVIEGVLVSPFLTGGKEIIIGSVMDPQFGPVVMVGLGGIFVEIFKDISFGIAPVNKEEAREMLSDLKSYPIIQGIRGEQGLDENEIVKIIVGISELIMAHPVKELDLNPVFCFADRALVGDARILLD